MPKMRVDKLISSQQADLSRSMVREMLKKGKVIVNGKTVKSADFKVDTDVDSVVADGTEICYKEFVYLMLNKPKGVVCSTRDGSSPTVLSLVPPKLYRDGIFPAGRLDKDTEGFVLLTDDGELAHKMLSPKSHVPKKYYAELVLPFDESYVQSFKNGVTLEDGTTCLPAEIFPVENNPNACTIILCEGMFHQVKRMCEALGNKVVYLRRIQIGNLVLPEDLPLGECLEILHKDVEKLLERPEA